MKQEDFDSAIEKFKACLGETKEVRRYNPIDSWRPLRTYGMHFYDPADEQENYFPNRELGICYYEKGENEIAKKYLEKSLELESSSRAMLFLNKCNTQLLKGFYFPKPEINFSVNKNLILTNKRSYELAGKLRGQGLVSDCTINDEKLFIELAKEEIAFQKTIKLNPGINDIHVYAKDLLEKDNSAELTIYADLISPELVILNTETHGQDLIINAYCTDDYALSKIIIDGNTLYTDINQSKQNKYNFTYKLTNHSPGFLEAEDHAGNKMTLNLREHFIAKRRSKPITKLASLIQVKSPNIEQDIDGPTIILPNISDNQTIYMEHFYLDGWLEDKNGVADLSIKLNGESKFNKDMQGCEGSHFHVFLEPQPGTNFIDITTTDKSGNESYKSLSIVREKPEILSKDYRLRATVSLMHEPEIQNMATLIKHNLENIMSEPLDPRIILVERSRDFWKLRLNELGLTISENIQELYKLDFSRFLHEDYIYFGSVYHDWKGITVWVQVVDVENKKIYCSENIFVEESESLSERLRGLNLKIEKNFPLASAQINNIKKWYLFNSFKINKGNNSGLRRNQKFIFVEPGPNGIEDGRVVKTGNSTHECRISKCKGHYANGLIPKGVKNQIKRGYYVHAK